MSAPPDDAAARPAAPPAESARLEDWLAWIGAVHPREMDLGLARVSRVAARLGLARPPLAIVTVGGTNGKGSTVAMLETIWTAAGHRAGAATSPHVTRFNERIRVAGREADDADIVRALARVERARASSSEDDAELDTLTYFEFATLAAMALFVEAGCEVAIMEVGLGGRLDAVNLWDADCAVLTSIALDHADWLGTDLDVIATEKAAIGRRGRPFVLGEPDPPPSLAPFVRREGFALVDVGARPASSLPDTALAGEHQRRNAACALAAVQALGERLPVGTETARAALAAVSLGARFETRERGGTTVVLDVAHNPAGAAALATTWRQRLGTARAVCVFAALADKDIEGIAGELAPLVAHWCCAALGGARASPPGTLERRVRAGLAAAPADTSSVAPSATSPLGDPSAGQPVPSADGDERDVGLERFGSVDAALGAALARAAEEGRPVLVCGSFLTIAAAHAALAG